MKRTMTKKFDYRKLGMVLIVLSSLIFNGCSKEEFSILDVPIEELESSFFKLAENTIDIPADDLGSYIISQDSNSMVLDDSELFAGIIVGSHLVTTANRSYDDMVFRKIKSFNRSNGQILVSTEAPSMMQAFEEYHVDFSKPNTITTRSDGYLLEEYSTSVSSLLTTMFSSLDKKGLIPFRVAPKIVFGGELNATASHPNTVYRYKVCNGSRDCFDPNKNPENVIDTDNDGVFDVAERYMDGVVFDKNFEGFYEITITDFQFSEFKITVSTSKDQDAKFNNEDKPVDIAQEIINVNNGFLSDDGDDLNYTYIPLPSPIGVVGASLAIGPIIRAEFDAKAYLGVEANLPAKINIVDGYIDYLDRFAPVPVLPSSFYTVGDRDASVADLFTGGDVSMFGGYSGQVKKNIGLAFGGALTFGAPSTFGSAVGGMVESTVYSKVKGDFGFQLNDVFNIQGKRDFAFHGNLCLDVGFRFDAFLFTDANWKGFNFVDDFFDNKIKIPENLLPDPYSFVELLTSTDPNFASNNGVSFVPNDGLCVGVLAPCSTVFADQGLIIANSNFTYTLIWNFESLDKDKYDLYLKNGANEILISDNHEFGMDGNISLSIPPEIWSGFASGTITFKVVVDDDCSEEINPIVVAICDMPFEEVTTLSVPSRLIGNQNISFLNFGEAFTYCNNKLGPNGKKYKILHEDEIFDVIGNGKCMNPSGFYLDGEYHNNDELFFWVETYRGTFELLQVKAQFNGETFELLERKLYEPSASTKAPCLCTEM